MKKNDEIVIDITDYTAEGSGVGKYGGMAVFVPQGAVGDTVRVKILKVKKSYAFGKVLEILTKADCRTENDCSAFSRCGGCVFRHISYDAELRAKENKAYETVKRIGGVDLRPQPIMYGSEYRYRNKAQYPVNQEGRVGFFATHSHSIVPCGDCLLQPKIFSHLIAETEKWIKSHKISIYNEETHRGLLRHIYIRQGAVTGEIMFTLVLNGKSLPFAEELVFALKNAAGASLKSVQININTAATNVILGQECITLYGSDCITDILCGVKVRLSALSFYQVNHKMAERLYGTAARYCEAEGKTVLDLYCGAGTIGLSLANKAERIIGVEIIPEAIADAKFNAAANGIKNAEFYCSDATEFAEKHSIKPDVVIVDPPRKGLTEELIATVTEKFIPERVVYVSCDVATLARDIKLFESKGYKLTEYTPADLFPRTSHCETVALLSRQKYRNEYEEYFMSRTVEDIMIEYGEQRDEWKPACRPKQITDETVAKLIKE